MEKLAFTHLQIEVTRRCNFSCEHCLRGDSTNQDLPFEAIDNLLDQTLSIGSVLFTGGEPLLGLDRIEYFFRGMVKRNIPCTSVNIISNGSLFGEKYYSLMKEVYHYLLDVHVRAFGKKIAMPKKNLSLFVSYDDFHKKFIDVEKAYQELFDNTSDFALVKFHNAGENPSMIGNAKRTNCGKYIIPDRPCRMEVYGKGRKPMCPSAPLRTLCEDEFDFITVCCDSMLTSKGHFEKSFYNAEFELEDNGNFFIADLNNNESILEGIDKYNKKNPILCAENKKYIASENRRLKHNADAVYRELKQYKISWENNQNRKEFDDNKDRWKEFYDGEDTEEYQKAILNLAKTPKDSIEESFNFGMGSMEIGENRTIMNYYNKDNLFLRYPYLTDDERKRVSSDKKMISLNKYREAEELCNKEYTERNITIEQIEAFDKFITEDCNGDYEQARIYIETIIGWSDLSVGDEEITISIVPPELVMNLIDKFHNKQDISDELKKYNYDIFITNIAKYGIEYDGFAQKEITSKNYLEKCYEFIGIYDFWKDEMKKYKGVKSNIMSDEECNQMIHSINYVNDYFRNLIAHPFIATIGLMARTMREGR